MVLNSKVGSNAKIQILNENLGISAELHEVMYINLDKNTDNLGRTGLYPDPLYPLSQGENFVLEPMVNQPIWITLHTENAVAAGDYNLTVLVNEIAVPLKVHVFDLVFLKSYI